MSKSLTEAAKEVLGGNVSSKRSGADTPKKLGGDAPTVVTPPKEPESTDKPKDTAGRAKPPGITAPIGEVGRDGRGDKLKPTTATGGPEAGVTQPARGKIKDGVNSEEDNNDELYEELEIGDIVEGEDGRVGTVTGVNEEGEVEVDWQALSEDTDEDAEQNDENVEAAVTEEASIDAIDFDLSEDVTAMFAGQDDLSEEFKNKVQTIFEAAVKTRVQEYASRLDEVYVAKLEEATEKTVESLSESVEAYLDHAVNEWVKANEIAIETNLRTELTEDFINGLRNLFLENYIDVPDEKLDIVEELSMKLEDTETKLNESIEKNIAMKKTLSESKKVQILQKMTEGLVETQREKITTLAENVEFKDEESFEEAISTLKENYFPANPKTKLGASDLDDTAELLDEKTGDKVQTMVEEKTYDPMDVYVKHLKRTK